MARDKGKADDQLLRRVRVRLFVAGQSPNSLQALAHLKAACAALGDDCSVEIVDVLAAPQRALAERVLVTPTLVRLLPEPEVRIVGNLSQTDALHQLLGLPGAAELQRKVS
jgi:circadian clock protein KaiB